MDVLRRLKSVPGIHAEAEGGEVKAGELELENVPVPAGKLCDPVVGDGIFPALIFAQMIQADHRHRLQAQQLRRLETPVAFHHQALRAPDPDGIVEAIELDALGDLAHVLCRVLPGIPLIGLQRRNRQLLDLQLHALTLFPAMIGLKFSRRRRDPRRPALRSAQDSPAAAAKPQRFGSPPFQNRSAFPRFPRTPRRNLRFFLANEAGRGLVWRGLRLSEGGGGPEAPRRG